jgi:hypothetical protein
MRNDNGSAPSAPVKEKESDVPLWSTESGLFEPEKRGDKDSRLPKRIPEPPPLPVASPYPPKTWLERWLSPDPRKAPREQFEGLTAFYWTGASPQAHSIRDISATGVYIITEERWYPGTLVLMTLQGTAFGEEVEERTICVHSRAVRWGKDGVGLEFVLQNECDDPSMAAADRKALDRFLQRLRKVKQ